MRKSKTIKSSLPLWLLSLLLHATFSGKTTSSPDVIVAHNVGMDDVMAEGN